MEYEVCSINSLPLLELTLFRSEKDYDMKKTATIYIIATEDGRRVAEARATAYKTMYKEATVKILMEDKDKKKIQGIINRCLKARVVQNPSIW